MITHQVQDKQPRPSKCTHLSIKGLMIHKFFFIILALSPLMNAEEPRRWTNHDGTKNFKAIFGSRSEKQVTLHLLNGKRLTFEIAKLHQDDQTWIAQEHPLESPKKNDKLVITNAFFDTLCFGDSRKTVTEKLKASQLVKSNLSGELFGRTGLNGVFETRDKIGGLQCALYFHWDIDDKLIEVTLRSDSKEASEYDADLKPCWIELANVATQLHGKPKMALEIAKYTELSDKEITFTHLWKLEQGGDIMLGTSRIGATYQVNLRFTNGAPE